jgi:hypothetical protein
MPVLLSGLPDRAGNKMGRPGRVGPLRQGKSAARLPCLTHNCDVNSHLGISTIAGDQARADPVMEASGNASSDCPEAEGLHAEMEREVVQPVALPPAELLRRAEGSVAREHDDVGFTDTDGDNLAGSAAQPVGQGGFTVHSYSYRHNLVEEEFADPTVEEPHWARRTVIMSGGGPVAEEPEPEAEPEQQLTEDPRARGGCYHERLLLAHLLAREM